MTAAPARRPRLLVLTQHYRPEPNFITADVAESLVRHFDVTVITAHPNYPHGRFYPGHRWWRPVKAVENGVTVWRLPMIPYHGRSHLLRAMSYVSFALTAAAAGPVAVPRADVVWAYHGPFSVGLAALWFRLLRARIVFTCADLWPESFVAAGVARPGPVIRLLFAYRRAVNRLADVLICATRGTRERYAADGLPPAALPVVPVWVDGAGELPAQPPPRADGPYHIVYAGNLGPAQSLETVVRAAAAAERAGLPVVFDLYGTGSSEGELRALAARLGVAAVTFQGRVSPQTAFEVSSRAFAQIVSLQPSPLFAMTVPSKVSFCCAAGAPILYGLQGEAAALVAEAGGGIAFDPASPETLVSAIRELLGRSENERRRMRGSLREYYERHLAKPKLLARYEEIFLDVLAAAPVRRATRRLAADRSHAG